jgi:radical SAM superfamily enzyme YgiQ (UPF0313 family)
MKSAGWEAIHIAPESGSKRVLELMKKQLDPDIIPAKVKMIKKAKLKVGAYFIVGYPGETKEDIKMTIKLLRMCRLNFFNLSNFQPLPGTPIYDKLVESGEIKEGSLPKKYSSGERIYTPASLHDFNFSCLLLKEYIYSILTNPLNIVNVLSFFTIKIIFSRIASNIKNFFNSNNRSND